MNSTMLYSLYLYKRAFQYTDMGYASAWHGFIFDYNAVYYNTNKNVFHMGVL